MLFVDAEFSQKLERTEAAACARLVECRARLSPETGAKWIEVAGAYAMFDGPDSPITQSFGLGMFDEVTPAHLDEIEDFFSCNGAPAFHEISPLAHKPLWPLLTDRGYQPFEFTSILYLDLDASPPVPAPPAALFTRQVASPADCETFARTQARGWSEYSEVADLIYDLALITARREGQASFWVEKDGQPIAAGALCMEGDVALLAGAATAPEARRQGAQTALLAARLQCARDAGCKVAMMGAEPGSPSQRNAERRGFRIAYTRIKWRKP